MGQMGWFFVIKYIVELMISTEENIWGQIKKIIQYLYFQLFLLL